jgi:hypothetical protein
MFRQDVDVIDSFDYAEHKIIANGVENELCTDFR